MANSEKIDFTGATGETLAARLDKPDGAIQAYALFAHCFTCTKDVFAAARIARALTDHGIAVLRFDFTGLGASEGEFANTNFSSNVGDLLAAADYLRDNHAAPAILIGHSLGGAAVLAAAAQVPEAKAVCTIGAPSDPAHVANHFQCERDEIERTGQATVKLVGRPFTIKKQFLDDIEGQRLEHAIAGMRKALLIFHSPLDAVVGIDNATRIFVAAKHPKSFVSLDHADHMVSRREDAVYVADVIAAWADRYVGTKPESRPLPKADPGTVVVAEARQGKFAQDISIGGKFPLRADEPVSYGGTDTGPSPYDYLLAGLGACTTMTLRMYAAHKGIALDKASVVLRHEKVHADDCKECETASGKIDHIERVITLEGDLDEATRARPVEIADRCPVHRTLHSEVWIETRLKAD
ncbi:MAG: alpha/beta fold hydrolase [Rhodobacterales bacterium]|nr:alpha/beta fold hydrolase [Rhodobacterales bacterium]